MSRSNKHISTEELLFEYLEGNLRPEEENVLENRIAADPKLKNELDLWKTTFVNETTPVFRKKDALYRPVINAGRRKIGYAILFILVFSVIAIFWWSAHEPVSLLIEKPMSSDKMEIGTDTEPTGKNDASNFLPEIEEKTSEKNTEALHNSLLKVIYRPQMDTFNIAEINLKTFTRYSENSEIWEFNQIVGFEKDTSVLIQLHEGQKKKIKKKSLNRKIHWSDVKRAWRKETTVVPME